MLFVSLQRLGHVAKEIVQCDLVDQRAAPRPIGRPADAKVIVVALGDKSCRCCDCKPVAA
jgi:hypothetical protein